MSVNEYDSMYELLCAYVLGETCPEESARVEAALESSQELRSAREQLEQTIALVSSTLQGDESLSDSALASLVAAAAQSARAPGSRDYTSSGADSELTRVTEKPATLRLLRAAHWRVAAALLVALGGLWAFTNFQGDGPGLLMVAGLDASAPASESAAGSAPPSNAPSDGNGLVVGVASSPMKKSIALSESERRGGEVATGVLLESTASSAGRGVKPVMGFEGKAPQRENPPSRPVTPGAAAGPSSPGPAAPEASAVSRPSGVVPAGDALRGFNAGGRTESGGTAGTLAAQSPQPVPPGGGAANTSDLQVQLGLDRNQAESSTDKSSKYDGAGDAKIVLGSDDFFLGHADSEDSALLEGELDALGYIDGDEDLRRRAAKDARRQYSAEEIDGLTELYTTQVFDSCRRRPNESPRDMFFRFWGDNSPVLTAQDALSTFAADVDTASYTLARRYLKDGRLPTKAQVRTEEFVNYAKPDLPAPSDSTLSIHTELAPSLFGGRAALGPDGTSRMMLRVGIRGTEVSKSARKPLSLAFAIDVSGSMEEGGRLELVKHAIRLLVGQLRPGDQVGLVAYSREARVLLPMTDVKNHALIESALYPLVPNGGTNAEAGLKMAYELASTSLDVSTHTRVILLSDGVANIGQTDQNRINADVRTHRDAGIYLNTIGVGMNNHNDVFLEQLANKGDGICDYVDDQAAAKRAIVERFTGALVPIASDVKIQVEFDPSIVAQYRLLGYENRAVADADFRNDQVDAGEIGAGHQVVALYELDMAAGAAEGEIATIRLRWKAPKVAMQHPLEVEVTETSAVVNLASAASGFDASSVGYRRAVLTAQLAEFLRRSSHAREDSFAVLDDQCSKLAREVGDEDSVELANLVKRTIALGLPLQFLDRSGVDLAVEEYQRYLHMRAQIDEMENRQLDQEQIQNLERRNIELEQKLRDVIRAELVERNG